MEGSCWTLRKTGSRLTCGLDLKKGSSLGIKNETYLALIQLNMIDQAEIEGYQKVCLLVNSHHSSLLLASKKQSLFVLKLYSLPRLAKLHLLHQLYLQVQLMRLLDHPGILRLHRTVSMNDQIAVITPFCQGGDLRNLKKSGKPLPLQVLKFLMVQLTRSVMFMHSKGLVHRDIKPANILITKDCHIKIADLASTLIKDLGKIRLSEQLIQKIKSCKPNYFQRDRSYSLVGTAGFMRTQFGQSQSCEYEDDFFALSKVLQFLAEQRQMRQQQDLLEFALTLRNGTSKEIEQHRFINWPGNVFECQSALKRHFNDIKG